MSEDGQWSIHRGSILIKASTRSKYHRRGQHTSNDPRCVRVSRIEIFSLLSYTLYFSVKRRKKGTQIFSNEKSLSSNSNASKKNFPGKLPFHLFIALKLQQISTLSLPSSLKTRQNGADPIDPVPFHEIHHAWMEDTVGGVVSWDVQIARDDGNVARGYEDHDGTIPYRAATLSTRIHSLSLSISPLVPIFSPLRRDAAREIRV